MSQQITLIGFNISVQDGPDDSRMLVLQEVQPPTGNVYLLPLPAEVADDVGRKLSAPHVQVAPASALKVVGRAAA